MNFGEKIKTQLEFNGVGADIIDIDITVEMNMVGFPFHKTYEIVRPYVQKALNDEDYDIILKIHRVSLKADRTTVTYEGEKFA